MACFRKTSDCHTLKDVKLVTTADPLRDSRGHQQEVPTTNLDGGFPVVIFSQVSSNMHKMASQF